jgi:hypothetical protein
MPVASGQSGRLPVDFPFPLKRDILFGIFYTVDTSENYRRLPAFTIGVIWGKKKNVEIVWGYYSTGASATETSAVEPFGNF